MINYQDITNLINEYGDDFESFDEFERILKAALKAKKQNHEGVDDDIFIKKPKQPFLKEEEKEKLRKEIERESKKREPPIYIPPDKNRSDVEKRRRIATGIGGVLAVSIIRDLWKRRQQKKQMMQR